MKEREELTEIVEEPKSEYEGPKIEVLGTLGEVIRGNGSGGFDLNDECAANVGGTPQQLC